MVLKAKAVDGVVLDAVEKLGFYLHDGADGERFKSLFYLLIPLLKLSYVPLPKVVGSGGNVVLHLAGVNLVLDLRYPVYDFSLGLNFL